MSTCPSQGNGPSRRTASALQPSGSRPVLRIPTFGLASRIRATTCAVTSRTCSMLSRMSSACLSARWLTISAWASESADVRTPRVPAMAAGTRPPSFSTARSTNHTPSGQASSERSPCSVASRVLPTPPGPTSVVAFEGLVISASRSSSASRPRIEVSGVPRLWRSAGNTRRAGNVSVRPSPHNCQSSTGSSKSRTRNLPSDRNESTGGSWTPLVASADTMIWPP